MRTVLQRQIEKKLEEKSLSVSKIEQIAGLKKSAVKNILNGSSKNPTIHTLQALAVALDCSILDLIGEKKYTRSRDNLDIHSESNSKEKWNNHLFSDVFNCVKSLYEKNKKTPTSAEAFLVIKEIYYYSLTKNSGLVDKSFSEWVIEKNMNHKD